MAGDTGDHSDPYNDPVDSLAVAQDSQVGHAKGDLEPQNTDLIKRPASKVDLKGCGTVSIN